MTSSCLTSPLWSMSSLDYPLQLVAFFTTRNAVKQTMQSYLVQNQRQTSPLFAFHGVFVVFVAWSFAMSMKETTQNGCFQKSGYPQIIHFNRVFHYKPSILGYPYFWKALKMNQTRRFFQLCWCLHQSPSDTSLHSR